jgi:Ku70/Ku80-like protein
LSCDGYKPDARDRGVPKKDIDELYLRDPYFIVPDGGVGQQAFAVIRDAIRKEGMVALGKVVFTTREHIIALEARENGLVGTTLRYPYEVRQAKDYFDVIEDEKVPKDMLDLAIHIVDRSNSTAIENSLCSSPMALSAKPCLNRSFHLPLTGSRHRRRRLITNDSEVRHELERESRYNNLVASLLDGSRRTHRYDKAMAALKLLSRTLTSHRPSAIKITSRIPTTLKPHTRFVLLAKHVTDHVGKMVFRHVRAVVIVALISR